VGLVGVTPAYLAKSSGAMDRELWSAPSTKTTALSWRREGGSEYECEGWSEDESE